MIFQINKYHVVDNVAVANSVNVNGADYSSAMESALVNFHQFASNYMADKTVASWELAIIDPSSMIVVKKDGYIRSVSNVEEISE